MILNPVTPEGDDLRLFERMINALEDNEDVQKSVPGSKLRRLKVEKQVTYISYILLFFVSSMRTLFSSASYLTGHLTQKLPH